ECNRRGDSGGQQMGAAGAALSSLCPGGGARRVPDLCRARRGGGLVAGSAGIPGRIAGRQAPAQFVPGRGAAPRRRAARRRAPRGREQVFLCAVNSRVPLPSAPPRVVWRAGLDLDPIDLGRDQDVAWLEDLIWPSQEVRRARFRAAVELARRDPPYLVKGDLA